MPYTGSGALACGLAMHKGCSKLVFEAQDIPTAPWTRHPQGHGTVETAEGNQAAAASGGEARRRGFGHRGDDREEKIRLAKAYPLAFKYSAWAMVEKFIPGVEVTVTVLGKKALPVDRDRSG